MLKSIGFRLTEKELELLDKIQAEHHLETRQDAMHRIFEILLQERPASNCVGKAAAPEPAGNSIPSLNSPPNGSSPLGSGNAPVQAAPPQKRSFLTPSAAEVAYMKEKMRQKARTEAMQERLKIKADFRKQAAADKHEYEYSLWKKRQEEKNRLTYKGPKVHYPGGYFADDDWGGES